MVEVLPWQCPKLGSCASSGHAWRLRPAQHSQQEAGPLGAQSLPRALELAASTAADSAGSDHPGKGKGAAGMEMALTMSWRNPNLQGRDQGCNHMQRHDIYDPNSNLNPNPDPDPTPNPDPDPDPNPSP